ncbi:MAG: protein kinase, partial [Ghiorsea sp.]
TEFPVELFELVDSLEILDLSGNQLSSLPDDLGRFTKLRILFLSDNIFEVMPAVLSTCPELSMVGFKANRIREIEEGALPEQLRWLILTDNKLEKLPASIGKLGLLQKLMLAGNQLTSLPPQMQHCKHLELLRISANKIEELPEWLLKLPRLSWLAFAGNPCTNNTTSDHTLAEIDWNDLELSHTLGEGASGIISQAFWKDNFDVAVKEFRGEVTSDGFPADEMAASMAAGQHDHLIEVIGKLTGHPEQKDGLLLSLIADDFKNLAGPPCLDSCTRDTYADDVSFSLMDLLKIADAIASAAAHLHEDGIAHGDLYGHNILINDASHCLLGDFGAATVYKEMNPVLSHAIERIEVRAFGCLLQELLQLIKPDIVAEQTEAVNALRKLQQDCFAENTSQRPAFLDIHQVIVRIKSIYPIIGGVQI